MMQEETKSRRRGRPLLLFYILVAYIFSSFIWWSYLLREKNQLAFRSQIEMERLQYITQRHLPFNDNSYYQTTHYQEVKTKFERQRWMIFGEGSVFLVLLSVGAYMIYGTFTREMMLARQQNNFLLSITHELKSPLASIKLSLQTLVKRVALEEKFTKLLNNSMEDVNRLESLVDNILLAAKVESGSYIYSKEQVDLSAMLDILVERLQTTFHERTIDKDIEEDIVIELDKMAFASVIINLVENAIKYSPKMSRVGVSLKRQGHEVLLMVKDEGHGIADSEKGNVFKKFYRVGNEEVRTTKGTGLGLFIVKRVVQNHGGRVSVVDNHPKGSLFTVALPVK